MDGPIAIDISPTSPGLVKLDFTHKGSVKHSVIAHLDELLQDAISAGEALLAICRQHGRSDDSDYNRLAANIDRGIKSLPV